MKDYTKPELDLIRFKMEDICNMSTEYGGDVGDIPEED